MFLVGDSGVFDRIVKSVLTELAPLYNFEFQVVLSRIPTKVGSIDDGSICVVPDGIESALPRFRIDFRNMYMLNSSDYVIAYVRHESGNSAKILNYAKRLSRKKTMHIYNIGEEKEQA